MSQPQRAGNIPASPAVTPFGSSQIHHNLTAAELYERSVARNEGKVAKRELPSPSGPRTGASSARALILFTLVWLLAPREPDVSIGRPSIFSQIPGLEQVHETVLKRLDQVRVEIRANQERGEPRV